MTSEPGPENFYMSITPGFVNFNECLGILDNFSSQRWDSYRKTDSGHFDNLYNAHLMTELVLGICKSSSVSPLAEVLAEPRPGILFTSVEKIKKSITNGSRWNIQLDNPFYDKVVTVEFSDEHILASTLRTDMQVHRGLGSRLSMVGKIRHVSDVNVVIYPLIIGWATLNHKANRSLVPDNYPLECLSPYTFEVHPEDIEEFQKCKNQKKLPEREWRAVMRKLSEHFVKEQLCDLLNLEVPTDWGGEQCDIFSPSVHISGKTITAAFLLKGPGSSFEEMKAKHLGKNGDQIYRLATTPAQMIVVQHCHRISMPVYEQLKRFALYPPFPKRFCLIDGEATYRILKAYKKLPKPLT